MKLEDSLRWLCDETRMLCSLSVSYGTAAASETLRRGLAQEVTLTDGAPVPRQRPISPDSLYDLASLTKFFAGVMAMLLVQAGKLSLSEKVGVIDPRFVNMKDTTVFDLLCYRVSPQTAGRMDDGCSREEALRRLFGAVPAQPPAVRVYSDMNAMIAKYVIEAKTGLPYVEALRRFIFEPCGMTETFGAVPEALLPRCVCTNVEYQILSGEYRLRTEIPAGMPNDPKASLLCMGGRDLCGHAGLFSTERDMIRFCQALLGGELLTRESLLTIGTDYTGRDNGDGTRRQSLGLLCFTRHPNQVLSELPAWAGPHAIGLSGFTGNHLVLDPEAGVFELFLGNRVHNRVSRIVLRRGETLADYGLDARGAGLIRWPDGSRVPCSAQYIHQKDRCLHDPARERMQALGWMRP